MARPLTKGHPVKRECQYRPVHRVEPVLVDRAMHLKLSRLSSSRRTKPVVGKGTCDIPTKFATVRIRDVPEVGSDGSGLFSRLLAKVNCAAHLHAGKRFSVATAATSYGETAVPRTGHPTAKGWPD